jgi:lipoyl-dependent peroxiredoxin
LPTRLNPAVRQSRNETAMKVRSRYVCGASPRRSTREVCAVKIAYPLDRFRRPNQGELTMKTNGSAVWQGGIKDGKGAISTRSGALKDYPYGFNSRFEGKPGTNPEELIGAAHAGCFTMALSLILGEAGLTAEHMETTAEVTLDKVDDGYAITAVHLTLKAKIPGADQAKFDKLTAMAKAGCPVSKLLNARITLDATLAT